MESKKSTKKHDLAALETLYREADECDKDTFTEQRSNLLLVSGDHYQKKHASFFRRIRDTKDLNEQTKIRLTKNHVQKICKIYVNNITSMAPGVGVEPKNESEIQDQKAAELNHSVWQSLVDKHHISDMVDEWGDDFVNIGEVACKVFWDPSAGQISAYEQKLDETGANLYLHPQTGQETTQSGEESGQPYDPAPGNPVYSGDFVFESIYGFNLLRDPDAKDLSKSSYLIVRKMVDIKDLKKKFPDLAEKIQAGEDKTMVVFDAARGGYTSVKNQVMLKEIYFRPCADYPNGYFYFYTDSVILTDGELPGGIFPIRVKPIEKIQTSPRGRSPIKTMRPYQAEINRAASKMAEHQITLGDDKLLIQNGTKISAGAQLPGVRSINYTGMQPGVLQGRTGEQYLSYMQAQIEELYEVMNIPDDSGEKEGQIDPYSLLFRSATQKKRFVRYSKRFESFLVEIADTALRLAKIHMPDDAVIYAVGRKEQVNIPEFRNTTDLCYQIKLVPQAEDIESKLGKQLMLNHALQYVGNKLEREDIGKLMKAMPYSNSEEAFDDLTIDYESGTNMILSLDRGERPPLSPYDNFVYLIKRLTQRMRKRDFLYLPQPVQFNYQQAVNKLNQLEAQRQQAIQMAESGFIPTGGYMVTVDLYVSDPANPLKTRRARIPYQALEWLIQKLETQGTGLDSLENMNEGSQADISRMMVQHAGGASNGMGAPSAPQGQESPGREMSNGNAQYGSSE